MAPLVLLVLLAFFFVVALSFTVWAALTVGSAARRGQRAATDSAAPLRRGSRREPEPRERKPWEKAPEPAAPKERRQTANRRNDGKGAPSETSAQPKDRGPVVQGTLWERRPDTGSDQAGRGRSAGGTPPAAAARTEPAKSRAQQPSQPQAAKPPTEQQPAGRVVVTPRKPTTDAFERFLEAEKRRD